MFDFEEALRLIPEQTVLCIGDVMLDDFVYGEVTRISPEAQRASLSAWSVTTTRVFPCATRLPSSAPSFPNW
jgi:hypothetical protein